MAGKTLLNTTLFLSSFLVLELCANEENSIAPFQSLLADEVEIDKLPSQENGDGHESETQSTSLKKAPPPASNCGYRPQPIRLGIRHIEGNGVGYNQGYTTLEGFVAPVQPWGGSWVPFLDLRGHVFNGGRFAANAGIGMRYLASSRIWGINTWYDYRNTSVQHYNQVSVGLESLGKIWDFRINGYLPVGKKTSSLFHSEFNTFQNHYMILSSKQEFALKGINAETGIHIDQIKNFPLYFATGPYYLQGKGKNIWGGEARASLDIFNYIRIEGNTSYDNLFKWIGQGQISLMIPLGGKKTIKESKKRSCSQEPMLATRSMQRIDRNEIIAVDRQHVKTKAINPTTKEPYFFWFVDNTSHSLGTYESPFNTLASAQTASAPNDVIYVFPGDGTTTGMDLGIALKDNQRFFGASITHLLPTTIGNVLIPSLADQLPSIDNVAAFLPATITLENNNEISGFSIANTSSGDNIVKSTSISTLNNLVVTQNLFNSSAGNGINLSNIAGEVTISSNTFDSNENSIILHSEHSQNANFSILNNSFTGGTGIDTLVLTFDSCVNPFLSIENNSILAVGTNGISLEPSNCSKGNFSITNNTFASTTNGIFLNLIESTNNFLLIKENQMSSISGNGVEVSSSNTSAGSKNTLTLQNNTINSSGSSIAITLHNNSSTDLTINNNTAVSASSSGVSLLLNNQSQADLNITNNHLTASSAGPVQLTLNNNAQVSLEASYNTFTSSAATNAFNLNDASQLTGSLKNNQLINTNTAVEDVFFLGTDSNTPAVSLLISNNVFTGGVNGFEADLRSSSQANISILNNQFNSPSIDGIFIGTHGSSRSAWNISKNTFSNSGSNALDYQAADNAIGCLKLNFNTAQPTTNAYSLNNASTQTLSLEPPQDNVGAIITSGTITEISTGGCSQ